MGFIFMIFHYYYFSFIKGFEPIQTELKDEDALPKLLVVGIALIGLGLLIANTALVAWFIIRKRIKGKNGKNIKLQLVSTCPFIILARQLFVMFNLIFVGFFFIIFSRVSSLKLSFVAEKRAFFKIYFIKKLSV